MISEIAEPLCRGVREASEKGAGGGVANLGWVFSLH